MKRHHKILLAVGGALFVIGMISWLIILSLD